MLLFFTDRLDTIDIIEGRKVESSHPWLVSITKFFHLWVSCRLRFSFQHVPSHTGLKWNDVADEDAKSLLDGEPASGLILNLVHASLRQFTGTTPTMELADYLSGVETKADGFSYSPGPDDPYQVPVLLAREEEATEAVAHPQRLSLGPRQTF